MLQRIAVAEQHLDGSSRRTCACATRTFNLSSSSAFASAASSSLNGFTNVVAPVILISCTQHAGRWLADEVYASYSSHVKLSAPACHAQHKPALHLASTKGAVCMRQLLL